MHPLLRPRRILTALLIGFFLGTGLVGLAVASDDAPPVATSFAFAAPMEGDQGVYEVNGSDAWMMGRQDREDGEYWFQLRGRSTLIDGQGTPHLVDEFAYRDDRMDPRDFWGAPGRTGVIVDAVDSRPLASIDEWNHEDQDDADDVGVARTVTFYTEGRYAEQLPCGLHSALQGQQLGVGVRVPAPGCIGHRQGPEDRSWFRVDQVGADGNASIVSMWTEGPSRNGKVAVLSFTAGTPYPVAIENYDRGQHIASFRLIAFDRGTQELDALELPPAIKLEWAPRTPWMFDETGIDHPFPLSEAVTYATEDPSQDLGSWLEEHPDAYMVDISYWDYESSTGDRIEWRATFRDDQELYHLHIGKRPRVPDEAPAPIHDLLGTDAASQYYYFEASMRDVESYGTWWPAPEMLPTVASMWAFYDAWASPAMREAGPNMYEIWIDGGEDGNRVLVEAGRFRDYPEGRDDPGITYSRDWAFLEMEASRDDFPYRFSDRGADRPAVHPGAASPMSAGAASPVRGAPFLLLDSAEAAGVGIAAVGASLLYFFWPLLKTSAVGLFSRVRQDQILESPTRRRIYEYITANPGCHYQGVLAALGMAKGTLQHHIHKLEQAGLVTSARSGGYRCFFARGTRDHASMQAHGLLKSEVAQGILQACQTAPGISTGELASRLGVSSPTVSYHVRRLREGGLLEAAGRGHRPTAAFAA